MEEGEWVATVDAATGNMYYFHTTTGAVQWEKPAEWKGRIVMHQNNEVIDIDEEGNVLPVVDEDDDLEESYVEDLYDEVEPVNDEPIHRPGGSSQPRSGTEIMLPGGISTEATSYKSLESRRHSRKSRGRAGSKLNSMFPPPFDPQKSEISQWERTKDPTTHQYYYYNLKTRQTQWEKPDGWESPDEVEELKTTGSVYETACQMLAGQSDDDSLVVEIAEHKTAEFATGGINSSTEDEEEDESSEDWAVENLCRMKTLGGAAHQRLDFQQPEMSEEKADDDLPSIEEEEEFKELDIRDFDEVPKKWHMHAREHRGKYTMLDYAKEEYGRQKKSLAKYYKTEELMSWQAKALKSALRKVIPRQLQKEAKNSFRDIAAFMGDRKSRKNPIHHIEKLIKQGYRFGQDLRDEIYCQIIKQLTKNPNRRNEERGWKLFSVFTGSFPPSDNFAPYVAYFLLQGTERQGKIGEIAAFAFERFEQTMIAGARKQFPTNHELRAIMEQQSVRIIIWFKDGSQADVLVRSQTRCDQVVQMIAKQLELEQPENYAIFQVEVINPQRKPKTRKLSKKEKEKQLLKVEMLEELEKEPVNAVCESMERILDIVSFLERFCRRRKRRLNLVFKCKMIAQNLDSKLGKHGWRLQYAEANDILIRGYTNVNMQDAYDIAAVQVACEHGAQPSNYWTNNLILKQLHKYLPRDFFLDKNFCSQAAEVKILTTHIAYEKFSRTDGYMEYCRRVRDLSPLFYGCSFFPVYLVSRVREDINTALTLAICEKGLLLLKRDSTEVEQMYELEQILSYGFRKDTFLFVGGHLLQQKRFNFLTKQAKEINDLLLAQINNKVLAQRQMGLGDYPSNSLLELDSE